MRFVREFSQYARPVSADDLRVGKVYFSLQFADHALLIPMLRPMVFLGHKQVGGAVGRLCFQDFESHQVGLSFDSAREEDRHFFLATTPENLQHIFEYEHALDVLIHCALKRRHLAIEP
jgi:hypothetical protein